MVSWVLCYGFVLVFVEWCWCFLIGLTVCFVGVCFVFNGKFIVFYASLWFGFGMVITVWGYC